MGRNLAAIVGVTILILSGVVGCGKADRARLDRADSLLSADSADSALRILDAIDPDDLWGSEQRAYYALLKTQAHYKCYLPIESDSLISIAEKYYRFGDNKSMYARASAYKGVVLMDMGLPTEAIYYIRQAEQLADSTELFMLGWLNLRLGELYQMTYSDNDEHIEKYKKTIPYFLSIDSLSSYLSVCYAALGQLYKMSDFDSSLYYINKSLNIDSIRGDGEGVIYNKVLLSGLFELEERYTQAKSLCLEVLSEIDSRNFHRNEVLCRLGRLYATLGRIDSAYYYVNQTKQCELGNKVDSLYSRCEIYRSEGRYLEALDQYVASRDLNDSILLAARRNSLAIAEKHYDSSRVERQNEHLQASLWVRNFWIVLVCLLVVVVVIGSWLIIRRKDERDKKHMVLIEQLQQDLFSAQNLSTNNESQIKLRDALVKRLALFGELISLAYEHSANGNLFIKRFDELLARDPLSSDAYNDILDIVNSTYYGLIDHLRSHYSTISEKELLICALTCVGYSSQQLFVILGAKNVETIYNQKYRIGVKFGMKGDLRLSLDKIVERLQNRQ